jgi:hypothetical protein
VSAAIAVTLALSALTVPASPPREGGQADALLALGLGVVENDGLVGAMNDANSVNEAIRTFADTGVVTMFTESGESGSGTRSTSLSY